MHPSCREAALAAVEEATEPTAPRRRIERAVLSPANRGEEALAEDVVAEGKGAELRSSEMAARWRRSLHPMDFRESMHPLHWRQSRRCLVVISISVSTGPSGPQAS